MPRYFSIPLFLLLSVILAGCDSVGGGEDTITLSSESNEEFDPIEYRFQYKREDVTNGTISVTSSPNSDQQSLDEALSSIAAASRSDIQSAKVTRVTFRRVTGGSSASRVKSEAKVFDYLSRAEVRLGSSSGPVVAIQEPVSSIGGNSEVDMDLGPDASNVSDVLKAESPTSATLNLDVADPDQIGAPFDEIEIAVFYSITVR